MTSKQIERFWLKVGKSAGCWIWTSAKTTDGYGVYRARYRPGEVAKNRTAHRLAWEIENGSIPHGQFVLHRCDVRACVRPTHLFLGTQADNIADCRSKGRFASGDRKVAAKLTYAIVSVAKQRHAAGATVRGLAREYGVAPKTMRKALRGASWFATARDTSNPEER